VKVEGDIFDKKLLFIEEVNSRCEAILSVRLDTSAVSAVLSDSRHCPPFFPPFFFFLPLVVNGRGFF
jgi:hypothetical protein